MEGPGQPLRFPAAVALAGVAHRRLQDVPSYKESVASVSTGLLLGWTGLAATVNLSAGTQLLGADPTARTSVVGSTLAALGAAGAVAAVVGRAGAATSLWRRRPRGAC